MEVLDNKPKVCGITRCQERRSYIAKHKQTREAKTKIYLSIYELFTNRYLKSYIAIAMSRRALTK